MRLDGWTNEETQVVAQWVTSSGVAEILAEGAVQYEQEADRARAQLSLCMDLVELIPTKMASMLKGTLRDTDPCGPIGFIPPLATLSLARVDWLQLAEHWAQNLLPRWDERGPTPKNN